MTRPERRDHPRLEAPHPVAFRIRNSSKVRHGTVQNLSAGGALILTDSPISVHTILEDLELPLPAAGDQPAATLRMTAAVCRVEAKRSIGGSSGHASGLIFLELSAEEFEFLRRYVDFRLQEA